MIEFIIATECSYSKHECLWLGFRESRSSRKNDSYEPMLFSESTIYSTPLYITMIFLENQKHPRSGGRKNES